MLRNYGNLWHALLRINKNVPEGRFLALVAYLFDMLLMESIVTSVALPVM